MDQEKMQPSDKTWSRFQFRKQSYWIVAYGIGLRQEHNREAAGDTDDK